MTAATNKAVARRYFDELMTNADLAVADEILADEVNSNGRPLPREQYRQLVTLLHTAFPDWSNVVEDQIAEGDKVVTRITSRGTHQGPYMGIAPTGRQATRAGIFTFRIADGRIVEIWDTIDQLGLLQQLGAFPAPA